ncbi:brain acid soluble protein 1-like [Drosophila tropicalis]|uniref:brain acid soluble protein 1-like n=1 Tax=Drosophila tropicalis TaxID=46794 RepID=UPI0035AC0EE3
MKKMNWFGAQNNCLRKGLNLADLATPGAYNGVLYFLRKRGNMEDFWFGGNDLHSEGQFTYISNGRMVEYMGGTDGGIESTHRSNLDDCLEVRLRENNTLVTDDNCQEKQYFICEKNAIECATPTSTSEAETKHSHEHLHHFHHDAAKREAAGTDKESVESDSRPADNTNSTEVGTSQEDLDEAATDQPNDEDEGKTKKFSASEESEEITADQAEPSEDEKETEATQEPTKEAPETTKPSEGEQTTATAEAAKPAEGGETTLPSAAPAENAAETTAAAQAPATETPAADAPAADAPAAEAPAA